MSLGNEKKVTCHVGCYLEPSLGVLPELLPVHRHVVLAEPLGEQDGAAQGFLPVDGGEVLQGRGVHVLVCPQTFLVLDQTVLEQPGGVGENRYILLISYT